jgi:hypothetical protein
MPPNDQEPAYRLVDPSTGDIVGSFYENGNGDVEIQPSDGTQYKFAQSPSAPVDVARLQDVPDNSIKVFESDGTFDATDIDTAYVEVVGGGGGGGTTTLDNDTDTAIASGGGGGNYAAGYVDISSDTSVTITVGSGGSAGSAGGTSSFGFDVEADGGDSGTDVDSSTTEPVPGGGSGTTTTGDVEIDGQRGGLGPGYFTQDLVPVIAPPGGDSVYGAGSNGMQVDGDTGIGSFSAVGRNGQFPGGGGMGGIAWDTSNDLTGDGANGIVIVRY